jgi:hypothetical protein
MRIFRIIAMTGLLMVGLLVAVVNGLTARSRTFQAEQSIDTVSKWEKRVGSVLKHIPRDTKVVGYVADWDIPGMGYNLVDQDAEYTLTQYALAPLMIEPGLDHEWVIGNFTGSGFREWLDEQLPSYEIKEIGFGIYVIHKTSS